MGKRRSCLLVLLAGVGAVAGCSFDGGSAGLGKGTDAATSMQGTGEQPAGTSGTGATVDVTPPIGAKAGSGALRDAGSGLGRMDAAAGPGPDPITPECAPDARERACGSDVGECAAGVERCEQGTWSACRDAVGPESERCDGEDDDCDGATDEACPCTEGRQQSCGTDVGTCEAGTQACVNGSWGTCQGDVEPGTESCATPLDDDCDGTANEGCACEDGAEQVCGTHVGACIAGTATCTAGQWGDCAGDTPAGVESCNSADDDCDGATDEGCPCVGGDTEPCGTNQGACAVGSQTCTAGAWGTCEGGTPAADEACNGDDDDCDGATDEGGNACGGVCALLPEVGTACDGADGDQCDDDAYACAAPNAVSCPGGSSDAEICNGQDDDCAGGCDDGFACCRGETRACTTGCGTQGVETCSDACTWGACVPPAETCNGQDDDCAGGCDDGLGCCQGAVGECTTMCGSTGSHTCGDDCQWGGCLPSSEVCNGQDDDCAGGCDDGFACCQGAVEPCTTTCGSTGSQACGDDCEWGGCMPPSELCNGRDDDCANGCDDGFACCQGAAEPCTTTCGSTGSHACGVDCEWGWCMPPSEVCNGQDDDCAGGCDDGFGCCQGAVESCATTCGSTGSQACGADCEWDACVPPSEVCNGQDDDCENGCDDGFTCCQGDARPCTTACDTTGVETCANDCAWGACAAPSELCNGQDDDCVDGCDNGFACCQGEVGECTTTCGSTGSHSCDGGCAWGTCEPPSEVCNDADDDCDGPVDEGFNPPYLSPGLVLMFDLESCPPGWVAIAVQTDRFVMGHDGDATYTETGGASHTHTMAHSPSTSSDAYPSHQHVVSQINASVGAATASSAPCPPGSCSNPVGVHGHSLPFPIASGVATGSAHAHTLPNPAGPSGSATTLPAYREVLLCQLTSLVRAVPAAAIAMFDSAACGAGFVEDTSFRDRFIRGSDGDATVAETGGANDHTHDMTHIHTGTTSQAGGSHTHPSGGVTGTASATTSRQYSISAAGAPAHNHQVSPQGLTLHSHGIASASPTVASSSTLPPYYEAAFCAAAAATCPPAGMTGLFPGACPAGWSEVIAARNRLLRGHDGDAVTGETGGSATHAHAIGGHSHAIGSSGHTHEHATDVLTSPTWWPQLIFDGGCASCAVALLDHTHSGQMSNEGSHSHSVSAGATFGSGSANGAPPWREYVVCRKN